jgi:hypothetical protein
MKILLDREESTARSANVNLLVDPTDIPMCVRLIDNPVTVFDEVSKKKLEFLNLEVVPMRPCRTW